MSDYAFTNPCLCADPREPDRGCPVHRFHFYTAPCNDSSVEGAESRCPNPYCDGYGWITCEATATHFAYRTPACKVGPHPPSEPGAEGREERTT